MVINLCEEEEADLLLFAGDLFHRQPLIRELKELNARLSRLSVTRVVIVAGNHDYLKRDSNYRTFPWAENVTMLLPEEITRAEFPDLDLAVYGLSYHRRMIAEPLYEEAYIEDALKYHILLAHGGDESHIPFRRQVVSGLGYDYVALGHIHKPQVLIKDHLLYAGALEPIDVNDTGPHGVVLGVLDERGVRTEFLPLACREYIHLTLEVDEDMTGYDVRRRFEEKMQERGTEHMYRVILEGFRAPDVLFDLSAMDPFGNIVEIRDNTRPAYDFIRLKRENEGNLLGNFIASFGDAAPDTTEYAALCAGVEALLESRS